MVWSLEEEEGKEKRGGIRGGRGRQAGGMMVKEENAMRKWGEEEDKHAEDLAGSEESTAGSFYNIRWISKFSDSSPHSADGFARWQPSARPRTNNCRSQWLRACVFHFWNKKKTKKQKTKLFSEKAVYWKHSPRSRPVPSMFVHTDSGCLPPRVSRPPPQPRSKPRSHETKASNIPDMFHICRKRCNFGSEVSHATIRPARWALSGMWAAEIMCVHICAFPLPPFILRGSGKLKRVTFGPPGWDAGRSLRSGTHGTTHHGHLKIEWQKEHIAMVPHKPTSTS